MKKKQDKLVFLDAGTLDFGGVSLDPLRKLGDIRIWKQTAPSRVAERLRKATIVLTNKCVLDERIFRQSPKLRFVSVAATGVNNIDLEAARARQIGVANVSGYSTASVVQFTLGFITALSGRLMELDRAARDGRWSASPFFMYSGCPVSEIAGKTLGIIGYGAIGRGVAAAARALGMNVIVGKIPGRRYDARGGERVPFKTLLRQADFVSLHCPLTRLTQNLIGVRELAVMKKGSFLINMARGGIVDEQALASALRSGHLAGAACDVLTREPPPRTHVLLKAPNLLLTPHMAWGSLEARRRLVAEMAMNIKAFKLGKRRNRVV